MQAKRVARSMRGIGAIAVCLLFASFLIAAFLNSAVVKDVTVTFDGEAEPRDVTLKLGSDEARPDYRVDLIARDNRYKLGVQLNVSAREGVTFAVADQIPRRALQEIILLDEDPVRSNVIARVQGQGEILAANGYHFDLTVERSFDGGMIWFFETPIGLAILWGIGVAILLIVLSLFAPFLS
jgi:hypothetical protein